MKTKNYIHTLKNLEQQTVESSETNCLLTLSIPPVVALSVQQRLGITVQRLDLVAFIVALLCVVEGYKEGCLLNGVQRYLVLTTAEERVTSLRPRCPAECQTQADQKQRFPRVTSRSAYCVEEKYNTFLAFLGF